MNFASKRKLAILDILQWKGSMSESRTLFQIIREKLLPNINITEYENS